MRRFFLLLLVALSACATTTEDENLPPTLLRASPTPEDSLVIGPEGGTVFVLAADPEGEALSFVWALDGDLLSGATAVSDGAGSQITLDGPPDAAELTCRVSDGVNELELSWPIAAA